MVGLIALPLGGCGSTTATIDPVAEAAIATTRAGGAQMSMRARMEIPGLPGPLTLTGNGDFDFAAGEGEILSTVTGLPAAGPGALHAGSLQFTELFARDSLFMSSPLFAGKLPGGARWMRLDLAAVAQGVGLDARSLSSGQADPAKVLDYLRASGGPVTRVGENVLRGTQTTHYRGTIDLARLIGQSHSGNPAPLRASIEKLSSQAGPGTIPVEVWIDAHNLVRKMTMAVTDSSEGHRVGVTLELELFGFGATPTVNMPRGNEVYDATASSLAALAH